MSHAKWQWLGDDHITYAVRDIKSWRAVYINNFGFREIHHAPDASPCGSSSMELYGLESGNSRIALVSPINRSSISHVEHFLRMHGDHSVQHVAYRIKNLEAFVQEMKANGFHFLGDIKYRTDLFGPIKQIFAKRFDPLLAPAQGPFHEFVERLVAEELYKDVEKEITDDDGKPFKTFNNA